MFPPLTSSSWARAASPAALAAAAYPALRPAWGVGTLASALAVVAGEAPAGVEGQEDLPPPIPPPPVVDPPPIVDLPPPTPVPQQEYTVATLAAARTEHAARQARLREAALMWEREREATDAIAAQIAAAEQLLASPAAHDGGATSHATGVMHGIPAVPAVGAGHRTTSATMVPWHDPADPLVAQLHLQARGVQNIRLMVPVVLEADSPPYAR
jgi:hypothetical protein